MARKRHLFLNSLYSFLKGWRFFLLALLTLCLCIMPVWATDMGGRMGQTSLNQTLVDGRELYETGRYQEAVNSLQSALSVAQSQRDSLRQAQILSNLSLSYQQLGLWSDAEEAIAQSLAQLQGDNSIQAQKILAQSLNIQGRLQNAQGKTELALTSWEQAGNLYKGLNETTGEIQSRINQAQALQTLGFYRRALETLTQVQHTLESQPNSLTKVVALRSLGDVLRLVGEFSQANTVLSESLTLAQSQDSETISSILLSLGNLARAQNHTPEALNFYSQAASQATFTLSKLSAQLNQLSLLIESGNYAEAQILSVQVRPLLQKLPPSRPGIYAQINFAKSLTSLTPTSLTEPAHLLAKALSQAKTIGDGRAQAYALGNLGELYEETAQFQQAQALTQQALTLAQSVHAPDIAYRWQWQLGRLLKKEGEVQQSLQAYTDAVDTLQSLRSDLVAINSEVQFSFRESVEPIYRELVSLLLQNSEAEPAKIEEARRVIESLQLAELDNFFRAACLNAQPVAVERLDAKAAIFYPIILPDRLEVVLSVPGLPLRHYSTNLPQREIETRLAELRNTLTQLNRRVFLPNSQEVYNWLIRPAEEVLTQSQVKTLVFVLDGAFRNIPVASLYDGEKYLLEKYAIALAPGLELTTVASLERQQLRVLTAGLTEARQGFSALPNVGSEVLQIQSQLPAAVLLNQEFTKENIQKNLSQSPFPVIHLATHGQFSSSAEETYILTWDSQINVKEFDELLKFENSQLGNPIQLLVLSACETARGDNRAALGLAGVAVRAGVGSTIATLWQVEDEATALLMSRFYEELANPQLSKAEALRRAQLSILRSPYRNHPFFWAPFVIVGNWL